MSDEYMLVERTERPSPELSLIKDMWVERGTKEDWEALHELHYKSDGKAVGRVWKVMLGKQLVAVAIVSSPRLLLAQRHILFPKLKPGHDTKVTNTYRAKFVNRHFNRNSRIVVDTLFRAGGISYRFLNLISRMEGKKYMEIQSSMSKFNPFAMRAGFKFVKLNESNAYERGLKFMKRHFKCHPADQEGVIAEIEAMPETRRERVLAEIRHEYYAMSPLEKTGKNLKTGTRKVDAMPVKTLVKNIQQLTFATPMYGIYQNPDVGRQLPQRLPLTAFDNQGINEPLDLEKCT